MKFFIDSANVEEIAYALDMLYVDGVTTNPRHIATSGKPFIQTIREIGRLVEGTEKTVSVEVNPHLDDPQQILAEARKLAALSPNFVIKLQCTIPCLKVVPMLAAEGIRTNVTLVFSAAQALQAMRLGAFYVSPFIAWKENNGENTTQFIRDIVTIRDNYGFKTQVLAAAIRTGQKIVEAAVAGADIVTAALEIYQAAMEHPYTNEGIRRFTSFWDKTPYE